ncbi:hypothetical protein M2352_002799 [Azospirillum fermentarium]|uniref:DUF29 domain-containing protein n=1 Tax=Azospirillum fermentarium TaxID=1233114 RepID=UPI0022264647|nr:DUF29 domain-containing protein [Azospirillum fermentarium]MCW2247208.1 hypothetical protein [Azospirillum fermentarium]
MPRPPSSPTIPYFPDDSGDRAAWLTRQAGLLRSGHVTAVDAPRIAHELEALVASERRELVRHLAAVMLVMLKWRFRPDGRSVAWRQAIAQGRDGIDDILADSPILRAELEALVRRAYPRAVRDAALECGLPASSFPAEWPFAVEDILNGDM